MAKTTGETVRIEGLRELQAGLKAIDPKLPREMRVTNLTAAETVAKPARARAMSLGGVAAHIAPSIKATAEQRAAKVALGGPKYPMAMGANFGAHHDIVRQTPRGPVLGWNQFPAPVKPDRILYRTIAIEAPRFTELYGRMIDRLTHQAFPDRT